MFFEKVKAFLDYPWATPPYLVLPCEMMARVFIDDVVVLCSSIFIVLGSLEMGRDRKYRNDVFGPSKGQVILQKLLEFIVTRNEKVVGVLSGI